MFGLGDVEGRVVLARHGESTFNRAGRFTGWENPPLTALGATQARTLGEALGRAHVYVDHVFTSDLIRTTDSANIILRAAGRSCVPVMLTSLRERDYGLLTGLEKDAAVAEWGAAQVQSWRRSYDVAPPGGESLRDVTARVAAAWLHHALPAALQGGTVLVASHGNTLRALVGLLEGMSPPEIERLEISPGEVRLYAVEKTVRLRRLAIQDRRIIDVGAERERAGELAAMEAELRVEHGAGS